MAAHVRRTRSFSFVGGGSEVILNTIPPRPPPPERPRVPTSPQIQVRPPPSLRLAKKDKELCPPRSWRAGCGGPRCSFSRSCCGAASARWCLTPLRPPDRVLLPPKSSTAGDKAPARTFQVPPPAAPPSAPSRRRGRAGARSGAGFCLALPVRSDG